MVELAFVVVFLLTMFGGMMVFGRAFWYLDALTKATRDGARYLSAANLSGAANAAAAVAAAQDLVLRAATAANLYPPLSGAQVAVSCDGGPCAGAAPTQVSVAISGYGIGHAGGDLLAGLVGSGGDFGLGLRLAPQTTMRHMR